MAIPLSYSLRNLLVRRTSTLAAALGIGLVVTVFILVMALAQGFAFAVKTTGSLENAMVLRKGSNSEVTSGVLNEEAQAIAVRPDIARGQDGQPMIVPEMVVLVVLPRFDGAPANVTVRGTGPRVLGVRPQVRILPGGRMFRPGLPELVVGRALSQRLQGLALGQTVSFQRQRWTVVGIFETGGTGFESEIWGDNDVLRPAFHREQGYQSITLRMADPRAFQDLQVSIETDPRFELKVKTESDYYSEQSQTMATMIGILGTLITIIMSVGAVFGAMNTMYAAVGSRAREVATLRALGFGRGAVLASFFFESLILSGLGGLLGCLLSLPIHGLSTGTTNWETFSELSFAFRITPGILAGGLAFALVMGALGGLLPSLRAARLPITTGLRQV
jgi:putative ABC transport system permease protein